MLWVTVAVAVTVTGRGDSPEDVVRDRAAPAGLPMRAGAGGPADGPVVEERAMADGEDRVAKASDVRDGAARCPRRSRPGRRYRARRRPDCRGTHCG